MSTSPNRVTIDLAAIIHNLNQVKNITGQKTKIMGVVKSDAYGHGIVKVAENLAAHGVDRFGVAYLHEALMLRANGIKSPIVVLCGIQAREEAQTVIENGLIPVVFDAERARIFAEEGKRLGKKVDIQVKVDTGMGRLGVLTSEYYDLLTTIKTFAELNPEGLISHLSSADEKGRDFTEKQIHEFTETIDGARSMGFELHWNNLANSAGTMLYPSAHFDMVRPGIMLYGGLPSLDFSSPVQLKPAMSFRARILQVKTLPDDTPVSYGRTYHTQGQQAVAVLSAGYGDGLFRDLSNKGKVLVGGKKVPIIGRVCMNMTLCDVTGVEGVKSGDEAVFLGSQGDEAITGDDMARWADTISYEVFCSLGQRHTRDYILG